MTTINVAVADIRDADKMRDYIAAAAPLMKEYGAGVVVRGKYLKTMSGDK